MGWDIETEWKLEWELERKCVSVKMSDVYFMKILIIMTVR